MKNIIQTTNLQSVKLLIDALINDKNYKASDAPLSYRQLNFLNELNVLITDRQKNSDWRRFSLKELVLMNVTLELAKFGFSGKKLKSLTKLFFSNSKKTHISIDQILFLIISDQHSDKFILLIDPSNNAVIINVAEFISYSSQATSYIYISLNEIVSSTWELAGRKKAQQSYTSEIDYLLDISKKNNLNKRELDVINIIRDKNYKSITIKKTGTDDLIIKAEKNSERQSVDLLKIIKENKFGDISITKRDGQIVNIKIEECFKF